MDSPGRERGPPTARAKAPPLSLSLSPFSSVFHSFVLSFRVPQVRKFPISDMASVVSPLKSPLKNLHFNKENGDVSPAKKLKVRLSCH